jgi:transposase-like protein
MPRYSEERKAAVLKKLLPPQNRSVVQAAAEEGISDVTLCSWLVSAHKSAPTPQLGNCTH